MEKEFLFLQELEGLKLVERMNLTKSFRRENSAEHSWHAAMCALVLAPWIDLPYDTDRVVKMLLIHDIVEIDAGDVSLYDDAGRLAAVEKEKRAAQRIFGLLGEDGAELLALWREFEAMETNDARVAKAMDGFQPVLSYFTVGRRYRDISVSKEQLLSKKKIIEEVAPRLYERIVRWTEEKPALYPTEEELRGGER